jgi:hypothetical protein
LPAGVVDTSDKFIARNNYIPVNMMFRDTVDASSFDGGSNETIYRRQCPTLAAIDIATLV